MVLSLALDRLNFLTGYWRANSTVYNLSDNSIALTETYAMYASWEPALENKWLFFHKYDHIEMFSYDPMYEQYIMWNMSSHRIQKVKKWTGNWENNSIILYLQEKKTHTLPIRVHHDPSGAYIVMDTVLGSAAESANIESGDLITHINGKLCTVDNQRTLLADMEKITNSISITLLRKKYGFIEELTLPLIKKPQARLIITPAEKNTPITWCYELDERNDGHFLLKEILSLT